MYDNKKGKFKKGMQPLDQGKSLNIAKQNGRPPDRHLEEAIIEKETEVPHNISLALNPQYPDKKLLGVGNMSKALPRFSGYDEQDEDELIAFREGGQLDLNLNPIVENNKNKKQIAPVNKRATSVDIAIEKQLDNEIVQLKLDPDAKLTQKKSKSAIIGTLTPTVKKPSDEIAEKEFFMDAVELSIDPSDKIRQSSLPGVTAFSSKVMRSTEKSGTKSLRRDPLAPETLQLDPSDAGVRSKPIAASFPRSSRDNFSDKKESEGSQQLDLNPYGMKMTSSKRGVFSNRPERNNIAKGKEMTENEGDVLILAPSDTALLHKAGKVSSLDSKSSRGIVDEAALLSATDAPKEQYIAISPKLRKKEAAPTVSDARVIKDISKEVKGDDIGLTNKENKDKSSKQRVSFADDVKTASATSKSATVTKASINNKKTIPSNKLGQTEPSQPPKVSKAGPPKFKTKTVKPEEPTPPQITAPHIGDRAPKTFVEGFSDDMTAAEMIAALDAKMKSLDL